MNKRQLLKVDNLKMLQGNVEYIVVFLNLKVLDFDNFFPFHAEEMRKSLLRRIIKNNQVFKNIKIDI